MKIIDRYIARQFILPFFYCLIIFTSLYVFIDLFTRLEDILQNNVPVSALLQYYGAFLPIIFVRTAPVAALLSTLYVLGDLSKYNEVLVLKASGLNIWRLSLPFFYLGVVISIATLLINDRVVPQANLVYTSVKEECLDKENAGEQERIIENIALYGAHNRLIHVRQFYPGKNLLKEVTILEQDENEKVTAKIQAKRGRWINNGWVFSDCVIYNFDTGPDAVSEPSSHKKMLINIEEKPKDFLRRESSAEFMSYRQLKQYIRRLSGSGARIVRKLTVDLHHKISFPFVALVIIFLGIPSALSVQGRGKAGSIAVCIIIAFLYYTVEHLSIALGERSIMPPFFSAWFANFLFATAALMMMRRTPK